MRGLRPTWPGSAFSGPLPWSSLGQSSSLVRGPAPV